MCNLCPIQIIFNTSQGNKPLFYGFQINDTLKSTGTSKNTLFFNFCYYSDGVKLVHRYFENNTTIFSRKSPTNKTYLFPFFIEDIKTTTYIPKNNRPKIKTTKETRDSIKSHRGPLWNKWKINKVRNKRKITNFLRNKEQIHTKITGNCNEQ
uniref:Uncharacterized protein n=1 Tax=Glycine max TaxID=3847 RepID=Q32308_SOYBN|nr:unknown [Glycine max]